MKKLFTLAIIGLVLSGCSKGFDMPEPTPEPTPTPTDPTADIKANVEKVFGVTFASNHDWNSTTNGTVTLKFDSSVKKVAVLASLSLTSDGDGIANSMKVLNQVETNNQTSVSLSYDAPSANQALYAAFYTASGCVFKKIESNTVTMDQAPAKARTRGETEVYKIPEGDFSIGKIEDSWAAQRGWISGEKLYMLADDDYTRLKMEAPAFSDEYTQTFRDIIFSYLPNGRKINGVWNNNLPKVMALGYTDDNAYRVTTGTAPIIVSPVYKCDGAGTWGNEVYNSDLYYYYFKEESLNEATDKVAFLQNLPKFKLIPFNIHFGADEDNSIRKDAAFAALYFGDGTPEIGTKGSFIFPAGYKIGFMVRAKTDSEGSKKQGELYFDGRLNTKINAWPNFSSSQLGATDPRATWFKLNNRLLQLWESGTDEDFNDIILEIEGGVEDIDIIPEFEYNTYTFCFEDREIGDYDLNDVVIKATRKSPTQVEYSIVACGAYDKLYVRNINEGKITDDAEIHSLFGVGQNTFINTESGANYYEPITVTKTVDASFSFLNESTQPYLFDETTGKQVKLSKKGEDPHGIMIPYADFKYPLEKTCIKDAYTEFNNWGQNPVNSTDWYTKPVSGKVFE
ncbi:MAG: DUF4842 domain-containing protein [Prevotella ruminicola]|jgi:hypothetical protein|uniref:DUF4842 domain-containing protein n=1 Tax=Xylanibacter ruminicola TaxID=839 RepID=A0A928GHC9_XYLRU|nr:DUF4842 domain-containing protein [Xylanibacter ruminicola]